MTASPGVPVNGRPKGDGGRKPGSDDMSHRGWDRCRVDGPEVAQQPKHVGRWNVHLLHRFEVLEVSRTMHEHARKVRLRVRAHDHLDRIVSGSGNAPQVGSRSDVTRARPTQQRGLPPRSPAHVFAVTRRRATPGAISSSRPSPMARYHVAVLTPRWTGHPARDKSVVLGGEEVELGYPHAPHGCSEIRERNADASGRGASESGERPRPDGRLRTSAPRCDGARRRGASGGVVGVDADVAVGEVAAPDGAGGVAGPERDVDADLVAGEVPGELTQLGVVDGCRVHLPVSRTG